MNTVFRIISMTVVACFIGPAGPGRTVEAQVTAPEEYLGYRVGADYRLTTYQKAIGYFELIAGQTDRMTVRDMGPTSMGERQRYAIISSSGNMAGLERYREIAEKLSLGRGISEQEAQKLADEGRVIAWIDVGLHASECAPSEHAIQLVYDLVTGEDPLSRRVRDNIITLVVFANPDGMTLVADWYMKHVGTEFERSRMPWLYHKYIGHDNNRDSFNVTQLETRNISRVQNHEWFPNVVYNHHQTAPFPTRIWIPPYGEPTNPNKPAQVIRWENLIGAAMGKAFEENNQPGAISRISFDAWYPGFMTQIVTTHNIPSVLTETALYYLATPHEYTREEIARASRGAFADMTKSAFYPSPWEGGWWRIGDAVEYCMTASMAVLDVCARYRIDMLMSKYRMATGHIERFANGVPYGWIVPQQQPDPSTVARMFDKLMLLGVEIYETTEPFTSNGTSYPAGTWIIPTSQSFGMFVKTMMEYQDYPDLRKYTHLWQGVASRVRVDTEPLRPYDVAGWTLPVQMGVEFAELDRAVDFGTIRLAEPLFPEGTISGRIGDYVFSATDNNSFIAANRILAAGGRVKRATESFAAGDLTYPAGTFIASGTRAGMMQQVAAETHVPMVRARVRARTEELKLLRMGHYQPWQGNMDEGWIRWILEEYEFPYSQLRNDAILEGDLNSRFDVISLGSISSQAIIEGNREGSVPPEYVGGIGEEGVENLREFVQDGGTLICNSGSCSFAIDQFGLPVSNSMRQARTDGFYAAGSVMRMDYDTGHPVAYGMPENGTAFFSRGFLFEIESDTGEGSGGSEVGVPRVIARFPDEPLLLSGYVENDEVIRGKATVVEVPHGKGRIILFGFNFHNRAQSYSTFKLFFNSLYYH
ncbi:MAG: hypothetical protein KAT18_09190 [Candidatus Latescibacteria bacterium]|nr:hypothetical protein [Candidatus Latescibacterota bacterium]